MSTIVVLIWFRVAVAAVVEGLVVVPIVVVEPRVKIVGTRRRKIVLTGGAGLVARVGVLIALLT